MKAPRGLFVAALAGGLSVLTFALAADPNDTWKAPARASRKTNPVPSDANAVAAGKVVYVKQCLSCHGDTGKGNGPAAKDLEKSPGDLSDPKIWQQTDGALFWKITQGRKPMPAFEDLTTETERWQIVDYIRTLAPKPAATQP